MPAVSDAGPGGAPAAAQRRGRTTWTCEGPAAGCPAAEEGMATGRFAAAGSGRAAGELGSSLYRLLAGGSGRVGGASLRWRISGTGRLRGQSGGCGACRSEGLVGSEHVPDGLGELAGDVHAGDRGSALAAQPGLGALVAVPIDGVAGGVGGCLDQRPAQVLRAVLGQRAAPVVSAGLVHRGAQPGVTDQLLRRGEPGDVADLGGDAVAE